MSVTADTDASDVLRVGGMTLTSRLVVGTGKYASYAEMARCLAASGTDCVTVAVRRERLVNAAGLEVEKEQPLGAGIDRRRADGEAIVGQRRHGKRFGQFRPRRDLHSEDHAHERGADSDRGDEARG